MFSNVLPFRSDVGISNIKVLGSRVTHPLGIVEEAVKHRSTGE